MACRRAWGWAVEGRARVEAVLVRTAGEWVRYEYPFLIFKVCAKEKGRAANPRRSRGFFIDKKYTMRVELSFMVEQLLVGGTTVHCHPAKRR